VDVVAVLNLGVPATGTGRELNDTDSCPVRSDHDALTLGADHGAPGRTEHGLGAQLGLELLQMFLDVGVDVHAHGCTSGGGGGGNLVDVFTVARPDVPNPSTAKMTANQTGAVSESTTP